MIRSACVLSIVPILLTAATGLGNPILIGACCLPTPGGDCEMLPEDDCLAQGGYWAGYWDCDPNPCPPATGACCRPDGSCLIATLPVCIEAYHGAWYGSDISCNPNPCPDCILPCGGACCLPDGHCERLAESTCFLLDGVFTPDIECLPDPCPASGLEDDPPARRTDKSWGEVKRHFR